jgi:hypothetical protein
MEENLLSPDGLLCYPHHLGMGCRYLCPLAGPAPLNEPVATRRAQAESG